MTRVSNRLYQIDLFRIISAFMVMMYHYSFRGYYSKVYCEVEFPILGHFWKYGYLGVSLFFLISGFVILMSVQKKTLSEFIKSRFLRLYPTYWLCLLITYFSTQISGNELFSVSRLELIANGTMFNGFVKIPYVDSVYWSLLVEMKFYIIIAFFIFVRKNIKLSEDSFISLYLLMSLVFVTGVFSESFLFKIANYFFAFRYNHFFISGMLFYQIYRGGIDRRKFIQLIISFVLSLYWVNIEASMLSLKYSEFGVHFSNIVVSSFIVLIYFLFYFMIIGKLEYLNKKWFFTFGALTYSLYLLHQNIGYLLLNKLSLIMSKYFALLIVSLFVIALSCIVTFMLEPRIQVRLKNILKV
jgi:peptidoglycan/LPS O-acetylase OafA/YrhL